MTQLPYTGDEFLASLDDGREVWIVCRCKKIRDREQLLPVP